MLGSKHQNTFSHQPVSVLSLPIQPMRKQNRIWLAGPSSSSQINPNPTTNGVLTKTSQKSTCDQEAPVTGHAQGNDMIEVYIQHSWNQMKTQVGPIPCPTSFSL
ncbi:mCG1048382 [Mus musculus]|nr:mCG1048382 [Mus musculus]